MILTPYNVDAERRKRHGRTLDEPTVCLEQIDEVSWFFTRKCAYKSLVKLGTINTPRPHLPVKDGENNEKSRMF